MHLFSENIIPALVKLWTGKFKGLDVGSEDYEILLHIWEEIGRETAEAVKHIPANFVHVLQNIATDQAHFTAESWTFWFIHIAPIVLNGRFQHPKYYHHACDLADIIEMCLKFTITHAEIDKLEDKIIEWVRQYERYVALFVQMHVARCGCTDSIISTKKKDFRSAYSVSMGCSMFLTIFGSVAQCGRHGHTTWNAIVVIFKRTFNHGVTLGRI